MATGMGYRVCVIKQSPVSIPSTILALLFTGCAAAGGGLPTNRQRDAGHGDAAMEVDASVRRDGGTPEPDGGARDGEAVADATMGGDAPTPDGPTGGCRIELSGFVRAAVEAVCRRAAHCLGPLRDTLLDGTCEPWVRSIFENTDWILLDDAVSAGTLQYDPERMCRCVADYELWPCDAVGLPMSCHQAMRGRVPLGGRCTFDLECGPTAYCEIADRCPGTCRARVGPGQPCTRGGMCSEGLTCWGNGRCGPIGRVADECGGAAGRPCAFGLDCVGATPDRAGRCAPLATFDAVAGGSCALFERQLCAEGLSCAVTEIAPDGGARSTCIARPIGSRAPCSTSLPDLCPAGEYCRTDWRSGTHLGACTPLPTAGSPCADVPMGTGCAPGHRCDERRICQRVRGAGEPCTRDDLCYAGACRDGRCRTPTFCGGP
ncbi:MAG: hypothetical protein NZ898_06505 [Myxococcota bacterium]|nr:hypothetical protein [Myxococcota bacterium]MDW8363141.1 Dickkopf N-terminal cysteine-rich domain-containing protein [Myxococcales bacterium]